MDSAFSSIGGHAIIVTIDAQFLIVDSREFFEILNFWCVKVPLDEIELNRLRCDIANYHGGQKIVCFQGVVFHLKPFKWL